MLKQANLREILGTKVEDSGDNWKVLCPFHDEKTPSFYIHKETYACNCFGCGVGGNLISIVARLQSVSETVARENLGISMEDAMRARSRVSHSVAQRGQKTKQYYPESWLAAWKKGVSQYVLDRGLKMETLKSVESRYDGRQKRQVFPHRDGNGNLVGAVGRSTTERDPKWYFYWGYDKGQYIYNPGGLGESGRLYITEGVFDALKLHEFGYSSCAILGSKATYEQAQQIKEADKVVLALDNDEAGREGTRRLLKQLSTMVVHVLDWPDDVNDVMDLSEEFLINLDKHLLTPVQWKKKISNITSTIRS